ncbi:MAG: diguanylate cyclase [Granulosicoccaceae bacterium]
MGLSLLLLLLTAATFIPRFESSNLPGGDAGEAPLFVLIFALLAIAALGLVAIYLRLQCRALELARSVDNHASLHDPMTGAANRRHFEQRLKQLAGDGAPAHSLMMIDLDRFKPVNDLYGHAAGDALLKDIATGFARVVGANDLVARLGGDEFALLLKDTSVLNAERTALAVLEFVKKYRLNWQAQRVSVGTSIGVIHIDQAGLTPETLMAAADEALYVAKEAGRGAIYSANFTSSESDELIFQRIDAGTPEAESSTKSHLPEDGRKQELYGIAMASLQPKMPGYQKNRMGSRRRHIVSQWVMVEPLTIGDEASPGVKMRELLEDAAAHGDGGADLARWVLLMALESASRFSPTALGRIGFVIPVPARAVATVPGLADDLMRINALAHNPIRHLTFVLHNLASMYDSPAIEKFHYGLHSRGARLGFEIRASTMDVLAPLKHAPYDELHLGRELSKNFKAGTSAYAAVEALVTFANQNNTTVIASDVDNEEELRHLAMLGVSRFSGPVINEPKPLHDVLQSLVKTT